MQLQFRSWMLAALTLLVVFLIFADISEIEEEIGNSGGRGTIRSAVNSLHSKSNRAEVVINGSSSPAVVDRSNESIKHNIQPASAKWRHNQTLSLRIRKQILKFLDAEKDISVLKGTLKPGDIIHYIFDRDSTMNVSQNLYELLPRTSPLKNKHFRTCAIVGNSGVLLNSGCGQEIDTHSFVIRCNLAPVQEYARDVGLKTDLVTMNPSVIQRAFEDLVNATWREKLLQRLHSLNGSILWIPAFMARGGKERVEWVNELILKHRVNILADQQSPHQKTHHRPLDVHSGHSFLQSDLPLWLLALSAGSEPEPRQVPLLRQPQVRLHLPGQPPHHALGVQGPQEPARAGGFETDCRPVRWGHVRWASRETQWLTFPASYTTGRWESGWHKL
uniref:ST8 alpha-N-acetyl-neuraminide alpha-2,8-sialyltransferase 2 n=1 Tax=Equus caballus TaxID=9796 RepID=A0A9L0TKW8_HORSE